MMGKAPKKKTSSLVLALVLTIPAMGAAETRAQSVDDIVAANIEASGGEEALAAIESVRRSADVHLESDFLGTFDGTVEESLVVGVGFLEVTHVGGTTTTRGWDGTTGWEDGQQGLRELVGEELALLRMQSDINLFGGLQRPGAPEHELARLPDESLDGSDNHVLGIRMGTTVARAYVDAQSHLLTRLTTTSDIPQLGSTAVTIDFSAYEAVQGVPMPMSTSVVIQGVWTIETTYTETVLNAPIDPGVFTMPIEDDPSDADPGWCSEPPAAVPPGTSPEWSGWGGDSRGSGYRDAERAVLAAADVPRLQLKWAFGFAGASESRSQPAIIGSQLIVGSPSGEVYSLDIETGCIHWTFSANSAVRGAISIGAGPGDALTAFFADFGTNVYAIDIRDGGLFWTVKVGEHPMATITGTATVHDGRVFVPVSSMEAAAAMRPTYDCCTSSGGLVAVDAMTGEMLWRHHVIAEPATEVGQKPGGGKLFGPSGAPVWSSPTVDARRGVVYIGTGENYSRPPTDGSDSIQALGVETGEPVWSAPMPDVCGGRRGCWVANSAAPTVIDGVVFAGGLDGHLRAYSTDDGSVIWDFDTAREFETVNGVPARGGSIDGPGPVVARGMVFVHSGYGTFNQMPGNVLLAFAVAGEK